MGSTVPYETRNFLLVERDDAYRYVLAPQLRSSGFNVIDARLALEGIVHLHQNPALKRAVIDLQAHTRPGIVLALRMRNRQHDARVILTATNADLADLPKAAAFGGILLKSPDMPAMAAEIEVRLGFHGPPALPRADDKGVQPEPGI